MVERAHRHGAPLSEEGLNLLSRHLDLRALIDALAHPERVLAWGSRLAFARWRVIGHARMMACARSMTPCDAWHALKWLWIHEITSSQSSRVEADRPCRRSRSCRRMWCCRRRWSPRHDVHHLARDCQHRLVPVAGAPAYPQPGSRREACLLYTSRCV